MIDPHADHSRRPLVDHLADYRAHLEAKDDALGTSRDLHGPRRRLGRLRILSHGGPVRQSVGRVAGRTPRARYIGPDVQLLSHRRQGLHARAGLSATAARRMIRSLTWRASMRRPTAAASAATFPRTNWPN